jgi:hypothetical protein
MKMKKWIVLCGAVFAVAGLSAQANDPREEKQVMATLESLAQAYVDKDSAALDAIYVERLSYGHTPGSTQTKAEVLGEVEGARITEWMRFTDTVVRITGPVAVVRCVMHVRNGRDDPNGTTSRPLVNTTVSVLWVMVKGDGPHGWQVAARQPYGQLTRGAS